MEVFGWIMLIVLALFGAFMLGLMIGPFIVAKIKSFGYRTKTFIEDEKIDTDKRSEQRRNRQELKRQRDFELADKRLDVKLNKVDKKIKLQSKKLQMAQDLEKQLTQESKEHKSKRKEFFPEQKVAPIEDDCLSTNEGSTKSEVILLGKDDREEE